MDLSNLPKLSDTRASSAPPPPTDASPPPPPAVSYANPYDVPRATGAADAWLSLAIGLVMLFAFPRAWQYFLSPSTFTWTFRDVDGSPLSYPKSAFFLPDIGVTLFGIAMLVEAAAVFSRRSWMLYLGLVVAVLATLLNVVAIIVAMNHIGFQIVNALAVAYGGYITLSLWHRVQLARASGA